MSPDPQPARRRTAGRRRFRSSSLRSTRRLVFRPRWQPRWRATTAGRQGRRDRRRIDGQDGANRRRASPRHRPSARSEPRLWCRDQDRDLRCAHRTRGVVGTTPMGSTNPPILSEMVARLQEESLDAILGARGAGTHAAPERALGKLVLKLVAQGIAGRAIPDVNCGLRVFRAARDRTVPASPSGRVFRLHDEHSVDAEASLPGAIPSRGSAAARGPSSARQFATVCLRCTSSFGSSCFSMPSACSAQSPPCSG